VLPAFDVQAPLLSLPLIFGTTLENVPAGGRYLNSDSGRAASWRNRLSSREGMRVGVAWAGNPRHRNDRRRSIDPLLLEPLTKIPGLRLFSLQKGSRPVFSCIEDLSPELADFGETAAVVDNLDLVISVDTAVAHLAGGLGKPVWTLLPFAPDWRWMLERDDSPWYASMRLFRQTEPGNWSAVVARVAAALEERLCRR
jgi:hypothetical protein